MNCKRLMNRDGEGQRAAVSRRLAGGFTLIELLVVVGIIGLLMAILLPALGRARQEVYKIQCASNLRQWGQSLHGYGNDNNGYFPNSHFDDRPMFHPDVGVDLSNPDLRAWAGEWIHFYSEYLTEYRWEDVVDQGTQVQHCPVGWTSHNFPPHILVVMGYNFLPRTVPQGDGRIARYTPETQGWVQKERMDGAYARAPVMTDIYHRHANGDLAGRGTSHWNNHVSSADDDSVLGGNFMFEDGSVSWSNQDEIERSYDASWAWGDLQLYFHIDIAGSASY